MTGVPYRYIAPLRGTGCLSDVGIAFELYYAPQCDAAPQPASV